MTNTKKKKTMKLSSKNMLLISITFFCLAIFFLGVALWVQNNTTSLPPIHGYDKDINIAAGESAIRVNGIKSSTGHGIFTAPKGNHYLIVSVTIQNLSKKPIYVLPSTDTYVKDPSGKLTYLSPFELANPFRAGELLPGDKSTGELSYLVPTSSRQNLYIDAIWSGGVIVFAAQ